MPVELIRLNPYASGINNAKSLCQSLRIDAFDIANAMTVYIVYTSFSLLCRVIIVTGIPI